jgi:uncharacterized tellurite resistance protein B-like protein
MTEHYHLGLLYLLHSLVSSDGIVDATEQEALQNIKVRDQIPAALFSTFEKEIKRKELREIYEHGIRSIKLCSEEEKLQAFSTLYRMSEVDGRVHIKEVRLLLYSIKAADIEFDDVVKRAEKLIL